MPEGMHNITIVIFAEIYLSQEQNKRVERQPTFEL
jgi:hypothetical protein